MHPWAAIRRALVCAGTAFDVVGGTARHPGFMQLCVKLDVQVRNEGTDAGPNRRQTRRGRDADPKRKRTEPMKRIWIVAIAAMMTMNTGMALAAEERVTRAPIGYYLEAMGFANMHQDFKVDGNTYEAETRPGVGVTIGGWMSPRTRLEASIRYADVKASGTMTDIDGSAMWIGGDMVWGVEMTDQLSLDIATGLGISRWNMSLYEASEDSEGVVVEKNLDDASAYVRAGIAGNFKVTSTLTVQGKAAVNLALEDEKYGELHTMQIGFGVRYAF